VGGLLTFRPFIIKVEAPNESRLSIGENTPFFYKMGLGLGFCVIHVVTRLDIVVIVFSL
jgi:hypothetical protein